MRLIFFMVAILILIGCTSSGGTKTSSKSSQRITEEEITQASAGTAYEAVQRLRPMWLMGSRGDFPQVYVDNLPSSLETIMANEVREIEFLNAGDATTRFGTGHTGGAIIVKRK